MTTCFCLHGPNGSCGDYCSWGFFAGEFLQAQSQCADRKLRGQPCYSPDRTGQTSSHRWMSKWQWPTPVKSPEREGPNKCSHRPVRIHERVGREAYPLTFFGPSVARRCVYRAGRRIPSGGTRGGRSRNLNLPCPRPAHWNSDRCSIACPPAPCRNSPGARTSIRSIPSCDSFPTLRRVGESCLVCQVERIAHRHARRQDASAC